MPRKRHVPPSRIRYEQSDPGHLVPLRLTEKEALDAIRQVLDQASDDHRAVIKSMFFDEFSSKETMELYEWSESKFYTTKHRALRWLRANTGPSS